MPNPRIYTKVRKNSPVIYISQNALNLTDSNEDFQKISWGDTHDPLFKGRGHYY